MNDKKHHHWDNSITFSVRETLKNQNIFLIGATGFLGRTMLYLLLKNVSDINKIYLMIRATPGRSAWQRFEKEILESPVFSMVAGDQQFFRSVVQSQRIKVVEGDASIANFGISANQYQELLGSIDVILNTAGNVDFSPPLDISLQANTESIREILKFCNLSKNKKIVHVSTCFVIDRQLLSEQSQEREVERYYFNSKKQKIVIDPEAELDISLREIQKIKASYGKISRNRDLVREQRNQLISLGQRRAKRLNRPNSYTYSKLLAELFIQKAIREQGIQATIVRPSIVETSIRYPFKGWNEGIQGSAPLMFLVAKGHRFVPTLNHRNGTESKPRAANLDCIPVDEVANGTILAMCALLRNEHSLIYQLSAGNLSPPVTVDTFVQVMTVAKRDRADHEKGFTRFLQKKLQPIAVREESFQRYSSPKMFSLLKNGLAVFSHLNSQNQFVQAMLNHGQIEMERFYQISSAKKKIFEEFMPFIYEGYPIFDNQRAIQLWQRIQEDERPIFHFNPLDIDYLEYLSTTHLYAVRKRIFPILEKRFRFLEKMQWRSFHARETSDKLNRSGNSVIRKTDSVLKEFQSSLKPEGEKLKNLNDPLINKRNQASKRKELNDYANSTSLLQNSLQSFLQYTQYTNINDLNPLELRALKKHLQMISGKRSGGENLSIHSAQQNSSSYDQPDQNNPRFTGLFAHFKEFAKKKLPRQGIQLNETISKPIDQSFYQLQMLFYRHFLNCKISGYENVPLNNQRIIIISNHSSHLDYGLIWYGLGNYARKMGILAAEDYFFNNFFKATFVRNFLNLIPIARTPQINYKESLAKGINFLQKGGGPLLVFPEGTRSPDGKMKIFKQGLGYLVYHSRADILPIKISGTYQCLPKGAVLPKLSNGVRMKIGPIVKSNQMLEQVASFTAMRKYYFITEFLRNMMGQL